MKPAKKIKSPNAEIHFYDSYVLKVFTKQNSPEKLARFRTECEILQKLKARGLPHLVEVEEIDVQGLNPRYRMKRYVGDSNLLLAETRGNVKRTANLILPLVRTLKALTENSSPIYHRDLKPENILVDGEPPSGSLVLADFGCAYLKDENTERITAEFRSVGARAFLAPEYNFGRVEDVTEKGDIFAIGKLLWYYVNGNKKEVFPYTLWFPSWFDIQQRFPNVENIPRMAAIIAACCNHDPEKRPDYANLIFSLEAIMNETPLDADEQRRLNMQLFDQRQSLAREEAASHANVLLKIYDEDMTLALNELENQFGPSTLLEHIRKSRSSNDIRRQFASPIAEVVDKGTSCCLWQFPEPNLFFSSVIIPASHKHATSGLP